MATNYPVSLQDLDATRGTDNQTLFSPNHVTHHALEDDTIEALQAKVGIDSSAVSTSLDYQVNNSLSISPGHLHVAADISDLLPISSSTGVADAGKLIKTNFNGIIDTSLGNSINIQTYNLADSPATWTKPDNLKGVFVRVWGGGGSGGSRSGGGGGGGGAACHEMFIPSASLGATETVTIGAGGTSSSNAVGKVGGNSSFGSFATAYGGGGGLYVSSGGGGGGILSNGGVAGAGGSPVGGALGSGAKGGDSTFGGGGGGPSNFGGGTAIYGGGGGGGEQGGGTGPGGNSIYGGAGGGGGSNDGVDEVGGTSIFGGAGGNGGDASPVPTAGSIPGGGGGGNSTTGASGAGGAGRVIVYELF